MSEKPLPRTYFGSGLLCIPLAVVLVVLVAAAPALALARGYTAPAQTATHSQAYPGPRTYQPDVGPAARYSHGSSSYGSQPGAAPHTAPGYADLYGMGARPTVLLGCSEYVRGMEIGDQSDAVARWQDNGYANAHQNAAVVCLIERPLQPSETLSDVAVQADFPLQTILDLNPQYAHHPDSVPKGAMLVVPVKLQTTSSPKNMEALYDKGGHSMPPKVETLECESAGSAQVCVVEYTVQPGDTLLDIANMFGVNIQELIEFNPQYMQPVSGEPPDNGDHPGWGSQFGMMRTPPSYGPVVTRNPRFEVTDELSEGARIQIGQVEVTPSEGITTSVSTTAAAQSVPPLTETVPAAALRLERVGPSDIAALVADGLTEGQVLDVVYSVTNDGAQRLTDLTLTNSSIEFVCDRTDLEVGATTRCSGALTVSAEDLQGGDILHTFRAGAKAGDADIRPVDVELLIGPLEDEAEPVGGEAPEAGGTQESADSSEAAEEPQGEDEADTGGESDESAAEDEPIDSGGEVETGSGDSTQTPDIER